ncbi:unnamed protein product [Rotaria sordida]|uniref:Uncharacterized protein n=1 Tax=Rotaria sordida TaxID=392033 RepID=A0A814Q7D7_9BILA|nr:unnamed protein product [Rotaria sordida]CAF1329972.1 unnamed protein product [Rotaria sordida]
MADPRFCFKSVTDKDMELFNKYKKSIDSEVRKIRARHIEACGTIHDYKIALPDNKFVKISFLTGGMQMYPPGEKPPQHPPDPRITVDDTLTSTADE